MATIQQKASLGKTVSHAVADLTNSRHSVRAYKPDYVPRELLEEAFSIAAHAESNSNIQPWRTTVVEGAALERLKKALLDADNTHEESEIAPIPQEYRKYRSELGHEMYGPHGYNIARGDKEAMTAAVQRNYSFFDAPQALLIQIDKSLIPVDILSVGIHLQTLLMLLQECGVSHCIEVSVAGYAKGIHQELGLPENMQILCGVAIGYEDEEKQINKIVARKDDWKEHTKFIEV